MGLRDIFKKKDDLPKKTEVIEDYKLDNIIYRKINDVLWLQPYDAERFFTVGEIDAQLLSAGIDDEETKNYLPGLTVSKDDLKKKVLAVEAGIRISYLITLNKMPVGMINLDPPKANRVQHNMPIWTMDYFVINSLRNKGIMTDCFPALLKLMAKNIGISEIYAWVHEDNTISIGILEKFFFRTVNSIPLHDSSKRPIIAPHFMAFKCPLNELVFGDGQIRCPSYWADKQTLVY